MAKEFVMAVVVGVVLRRYSMLGSKKRVNREE